MSPSETREEIVLRIESQGHNPLPSSSLSLSWSVDVMQRIFARPELEIYAWRIQGAA